jgi:hypothetical protein
VLEQIRSDCVNENETPGCRASCCPGDSLGSVEPVTGRLIQTAEGSSLGVGVLPLKRRGLAWKAVLRVCEQVSLMAGVPP